MIAYILVVYKTDNSFSSSTFTMKKRVF